MKNTTPAALRAKAERYEQMASEYENASVRCQTVANLCRDLAQEKESKDPAESGSDARRGPRSQAGPSLGRKCHSRVS
jgi:hypothetical protein